MKALTYQDWLDAGFQVRKGQKSKAKNKAREPTFTRDQVEIANERPPREEA